MEKNFYKEEYKMFIFENDEMNDEELISAIDNSPTYKRTVQELDTFKSMIQARNNTPAEVVVTNEEEEQQENNEEEETI